MTRKKSPPAEHQGPDFVGATPTDLARQEVLVREHSDKVIADWGDGLPYAREHYIAEIRRDMQRTVDAALAIGRRLIVMKSLESHGGWLECMQLTGLGNDTAQRMMAAARRMEALPNTATSRHLALAAGNQSKLFELLTLDDDQFSALAEGDEVAGITLDDVEKMTVKELRAALRDARADATAKDERIAARDQTVNKLQDDVAKARRQWRSATPDEQRLKLERAVSDAAFSVRVAISSDSGEHGLRGAIHALASHAADNNQDVSQFLGHAIAELLTTLLLVRDDETLPVAIPVIDGAGGA